ncbi:MAG: chemotaxis protein CheW [Pseudomonadota bacterium]
MTDMPHSVDGTAYDGQEAATGPSLMALTFELHEEVFAVEVSHVHEVIDPQPVTRVPNADPFAPGLINARGAVVAVLDLRQRLGMAEQEETQDTRFVVLESAMGDDRAKFAIVADRVHEVVEIPCATIQPAPDLSMSWPPEYIRGIANRDGTLVSVLDAFVVFHPDHQS